MILTEEQIKADNERWKVRDIKQELHYLGYSVPNRLCVTNDDLRFNAFVARKALGMVEQLSAQHEIIRCKDCKHSHMTSDGKLCKYCDMFELMEMYVDADFFCGYAERRTE